MDNIKNLYQAFRPGDKVIVDQDRVTESVKEVVRQTPRRVFTTVKNDNGYQWEIMTNRLKYCKD
jgi:hypothetical protein